MLMLLLSIVMYAQSYHTTKGFTYSKVTVQRADGRTDFEDFKGGAIIFGTKEGKEVIGISLGRDIVYQGFVIETDKGMEGTQYVVSYKFYANLKRVYTPIILSEIYNTRYSQVPSLFFLAILDKNAEKPIKYNLFSGIAKSDLYK